MNQEMAQKRTKLLFVVTKSNFGGAQRYVFDLATGLSRDRYDISVLAGVSEGTKTAGTLVDMLQRAHIRTIFLPHMQRDIRLFSDVRTFFRLIQIFRSERPDVVHLNSSKAGGLGALAARLSGVKRIVLTSHGLPYDEPRGLLSRSLIFIATWVTFMLVHTVICISENTSTRAKHLPFCGRKTVLVYNGLGAISMLSRAEARSKVLSMLDGVPESTRLIGTVSELVPNKGLGYALKAIDILRRTDENFMFVVIGSGDLMPTLMATVQSRGLEKYVRFVGYVPDASKLLRAFDVFTLTSRKEGLPYALLEAAQASLPVVATDIPGNRDIIENGVSGALCPLHDAEQCADSMHELLNDEGLRSRFGTALAQKAASNFHLDTMIRETERLYQF